MKKSNNNTTGRVAESGYGYLHVTQDADFAKRLILKSQASTDRARKVHELNKMLQNIKDKYGIK
ncbi:hypothetical protein [Robiginitalea aurantiaca]|uniref:Uncharacterized protein n=1 Tax=Robiginitalea aurantiaca TaxID=3056915 RepID=A0ABT7WFB7_9FLAO|nr:hypothetical protein [Robiginitalea aurantiaca]MDM9631610.1 hypothetical protein [Robiginitalea aurantiaca]